MKKNCTAADRKRVRKRRIRFISRGIGKIHRKNTLQSWPEYRFRRGVSVGSRPVTTVCQNHPLHKFQTSTVRANEPLRVMTIVLFGPNRYYRQHSREINAELGHYLNLQTRKSYVMKFTVHVGAYPNVETLNIL